MDGVKCYPPPADHDHDTDPYATMPERGRIVCRACGHIENPGAGFGVGLLDDAADADAALTKPTLRRAVARCLARARESGRSADADRAFQTVDHLKSQPEYATRDADIAAIALALAVRHG